MEFVRELRKIGIQAVFTVIGVVAAGVSTLEAQPAATPDTFPRTPPKSPTEALDSFRVLDGFRLELVAAEPLVADPVDIAYDPDGRAYVVEMRGYPLPAKPEDAWPAPIGRIRLLEDVDGDGKYDRSHVFVEDLDWPTSVCIWRKGIFVAAAPDIWYFEDTDGDHRADIRKKVYTGFVRTNVQALFNGLRVGLDNWITGTASGNGGSVTPVEQPGTKPVVVTRRDFRFHPDKQRFEATSGGARFGHSFNDWGDRFLCNIRNPVQHVALPLEGISRNPHIATPPPVHDVAASGEELPVFRISPVEPWREFRAQRWAAERVNYPQSELVGAGFFTSSSGITIYRGGAYPLPYQGNAFVADVASNVIHREILTPTGVTYRGARGDEGAEFVSSTDIWFRPVNFANAPDGTLHILDMYREYIEHPWSIPDDILAKLDLSSGNDMGRIWRLVPADFAPPARPRMSQDSLEVLVSHLNSPHAWWRETAQRVLVERGDQAAVVPLRSLLKEAATPLARIHALWTIVGLGAIQEEDIATALADPDAPVREQALRALSDIWSQPSSLIPKDGPALNSLIAKSARDESIRVRYRAAFLLGEIPATPQSRSALTQIARLDAADQWVRTAVLSSSRTIAGQLLNELLQSDEFADRSGGLEVLKGLAQSAAAENSPELPKVYARFGEAGSRALPDDYAYAIIAGLAEGSLRRKTTLSAATQGHPGIAQFLERAGQLATDPAADLAARLQALTLLKYRNDAEVRQELLELLTPTHPPEIRVAATRLLCGFADGQVAEDLISRWRTLSPAVREAALEGLLARPAWHESVLTAMEGKIIIASEVPPARRRFLLASSRPEIKARAEKLLGASSLSPRATVIAEYAKSLQTTPDLKRGAAIYERECAQCHKLGNAGYDVGPNLGSVRHRSADEILLQILDPNREVKSNYIDYAVSLADGRVLSGLLADESASNLTLKRAKAETDVLPRADIDELASSGKSFMPEGLEQRITPQEMAHLLAYLRSSH